MPEDRAALRIGIVGKMASGKSTLAKCICEQWVAAGHEEEELRTMAFADEVKRLASTLFGMTTKDRPLLQQIGTKMREIDPDVWASCLLRKVEAQPARGVVVDDVRYANEAAALRRSGFTLVRIEVDGATQLRRLQAAYPSTWEQHARHAQHESERFEGVEADISVGSGSIDDPARLRAFARSLIGL